MNGRFAGGCQEYVSESSTRIAEVTVNAASAVFKEIP